MKINKDAIDFFYHIFFSCYIPNKIYEYNEQVFKAKVELNCDMDFDEFCHGLQEWESRKNAIISLAKQAGKTVIDKEVLTEYFGGVKHTEVVVDGLKEEGVPENGRFYAYSIFNHMLMPIRIVAIHAKHPVITGIYENNGFAIEIRGILFYEAERNDIFVGKMILSHYPMMVDCSPEESSVKMLLANQREDHIFMDSVRYFKDGVNHVEFPLLRILKARMKI